MSETFHVFVVEGFIFEQFHQLIEKPYLFTGFEILTLTTLEVQWSGSHDSWILGSMLPVGVKKNNRSDLGFGAYISKALGTMNGFL